MPKHYYNRGNMMNIEVLVTTMNSDGFSLLKKMNIRSNVVIANQCEEVSLKEGEISGYNYVIVNSKTKGLSRNRNTAITYSRGDILLFCDDDMILVDDYVEIISKVFQSNSKVDAVKFYCRSQNDLRPLSFIQPKRFKKASISNIMSAGVVALAIKKSVLIKNNFRFHEDLGAGTKHQFGEDSLFLKQLIDSGIGVYISPIFLATVKQENSTWFAGYNDLFFYNAGYVYWILYKQLSFVVSLRRALKMRKNNNCKLSFLQMMKQMKKGIRDAKSNKY